MSDKVTIFGDFKVMATGQRADEPTSRELTQSLTHFQTNRKALGIPFQGAQPAALYLSPIPGGINIETPSAYVEITPTPKTEMEAKSLQLMVHDRYRAFEDALSQEAPHGFNVIIVPEIDTNGNNITSWPIISYPVHPKHTHPNTSSKSTSTIQTGIPPSLES